MSGGSSSNSSSNSSSSAFPATLLAFQALCAFIWLFGGEYASDASSNASGSSPHAWAPSSLYGMWVGVHVMMLFGFGNLMTFLHRYGYSASGYTFVMTCLGLQWCIINYDFWHGLISQGRLFTRPSIDLAALFQGDFGVAAVLISFGGLLGKVSPTQLLWLCMLEIVFYAVNEALVSEVLLAADAGGSIVIHTFGAYFGLVASYLLTPPETSRPDGWDRDNTASYSSDMLAMIGTLFLFLYWPSFNGGLLDGTANQQERALVNTVLSLAGSCVATFLLSKKLRGHFSMVDVQNATLAGGVAVGSTCNMDIHPGAALCIGLLAGALSTAGFAKLQPFLADTLDLQDTCGIHNLHGMPGVLGGLLSVVAALVIPASAYGGDIHAIYDARRDDGSGRTAFSQATFQLLALSVTLLIAVAGGAITAFVLKAVPGIQLGSGAFFCDDSEWEVPAPASHDTLEKIGLYKRPTYSAPSSKHYTSIINNGAAAKAAAAGGGGGYNTIV